MSYTIKNLRDVDDSAGPGGFGAVQEARFATGDLGASDTGVSLHLVRAGARQAFGHRHDKAEEVYVVLRGTGRAKLDEEIVELRELDALRLAPSVARAFQGGPDGLEILAVGPRHKGDGEILQDFWPAD